MGSIERVANHEAGHAVACIWFGVPIDRMSIVAANGSLGHVEHDFGRMLEDVEDIHEERQKSEAQAIISLAGAATEANRAGSDRDVNWDDEQYRPDVVQASQMLDSFSDHDDEFRAYFKYIAERTKSLVARRQFMVGVDALIEALMGRRELTGEEAASLVRAAWKQAAS
jgi:hypothetical protein